MFLDQIANTKRKEILDRIRRFSPQDWERAYLLSRGLPLKEKMMNEPAVSIIAEVKSASPSKGIISEKVDPVQIAKGYEEGGATAVSVLTDSAYFRGNNDFLVQVKQNIGLPVLRKDFILDEIQVLESKLIGADVILLIVALLNEKRLQKLTKIAHQLGMEVLVEIHEQKEIPLALAADADVIGINNRNLYTFETDLSHTEKLRSRLPADQPVIGESGVLSLQDARRIKQAGVQGMLVGEYLMRQSDPAQAVRQLREGLI